MRRFAMLLSLFTVTGVFALSGCDSVQTVTAPEAQVRAEFAAKKSIRRIIATVSAGSAEAVVDSRGGTIIVEGSDGKTVAMLTVPAGTVKKNTTFTIDVAADYSIELSATSAHGESNDVGQAGFKKGVQLWFLVSRMPSATGALGVAELKSNGQLIPVDSDIQFYGADVWLVGTLRHFSGYVPIEQ